MTVVTLQSLTMQNTDLSRLVTVGTIAAHINRSRQSVYHALERLGIQPAISLVTGNLYDPAHIPAIEAAMRRRNCKQR